MTAADAGLARKALAPYLNAAPDVPALERDLSALAGLDRYQGITWQMMGPPGKEGLLIRARPKAYAPPFVMLGINLENTTSSDFKFQLASRYLGFDTFGTGSELRLDFAIGSDPITRRSRLSAHRNVRAVCAGYRRTASDARSTSSLTKWSSRSTGSAGWWREVRLG